MSKLPSIAGAVRLKPGRERSVLGRHPWIFSGAVEQLPRCEDGSLVEVLGAGGEFLAVGYLNRSSSISIRFLAFEKCDPLERLSALIDDALAMRRRLLADTDAYRLVNGEGDGIPGLVVDRYRDLLVMQVSTLGIEKLKPWLIEELKRKCKPCAIYEKSSIPSRTEEGMEEFEGLLWGEEIEEAVVREHGLQLIVPVKSGQKTGLFLDQREMRAFIEKLAPDRRVLNCFCYTGSFSLAALRGGARLVHSLDSSKHAIELAKRNFELNGRHVSPEDFIVEDTFKYLRSAPTRYDLIILDPPAFAKKRSHVERACRGYGEINREAMRRIEPGGVVVTFSCSYYVDERLFQQVIFQAAKDAGRQAQILQRHRQALDHPVSIYHPEGQYLKGLVLRVV